MCDWVRSRDGDQWLIECRQCGDSEYVANEDIDELGIPDKEA